jgi:hypothetical protein
VQLKQKLCHKFIMDWHMCHYDSNQYGRQYSPYNILYVCQWGAHVMTKFPITPNPPSWNWTFLFLMTFYLITFTKLNQIQYPSTHSCSSFQILSKTMSSLSFELCLPLQLNIYVVEICFGNLCPNFQMKI